MVKLKAPAMRELTEDAVAKARACLWKEALAYTSEHQRAQEFLPHIYSTKRLGLGLGRPLGGCACTEGESK